MPPRPIPPPQPPLDRLVQRALTGTLLALAASLVAVAVGLLL
jgi:hypothetical protein